MLGNQWRLRGKCTGNRDRIRAPLLEARDQKPGSLRLSWKSRQTTPLRTTDQKPEHGVSGNWPRLQRQSFR
jgi:hypothetical protein